MEKDVPFSDLVSKGKFLQCSGRLQGGNGSDLPFTGIAQVYRPVSGPPNREGSRRQSVLFSHVGLQRHSTLLSHALPLAG